MKEKISRRDLLKLAGIGAVTTAVLVGCGGPQKVEAAAWKLASPEEKRIQAEQLVTGWMSKIQASQKEYDFNEVDTQIGYDEASRVEKRYTNLGYRAAESLIGLGLVPPGKNFLKVHSQDDTTSPISGLLRPTHKISSETVSVNSPEKVDLMVCKKTDEEKADWFGGKASHITFDALVNATMELDNPYEKQSIVIYPLSKYNISTGENEKTQWHYWLESINKGTANIDIPEMPVSSNALRVHQELQQLFPEINLPPVKLEAYKDTYYPKRAFMLDLKEFLWENPKIAVGFSRIINLASSAMKGSFGREFLTTEMVRRVLKEEEWKWDRPVMDLPPGDKIEMYTQGLLILVDELNQYLFYTPSRVEADGLTQKTKKQKKIKA